MIKLTILLLFANGYQTHVIDKYDTVGECRLSQEYYQEQIKHKKVIFTCLEEE